MPKIHRLAENVYGITELFHPAGWVNAGFIATENFVIHIDAGMTINDGKYLLENSMKKAKEPEELWLILTHNHSDHIFGMKVFKEAGAKIIAHEWVKKFLLSRTLPLFRRVKDTYKDFIIKMMVKRMGFNREKAEEILGDVELFVPDKVFQEDFSLKFDEEIVLELICTPGHVPGEISVYHPESKTLFAGDTVYEGMPLTTKFGGPKEWKQWIKSLEKLQQLDIKKIVPGPGPWKNLRKRRTAKKHRIFREFSC